MPDLPEGVLAETGSHEAGMDGRAVGRNHRNVNVGGVLGRMVLGVAPALVELEGTLPSQFEVAAVRLGSAARGQQEVDEGSFLLGAELDLLVEVGSLQDFSRHRLATNNPGRPNLRFRPLCFMLGLF